MAKHPWLAGFLFFVAVMAAASGVFYALADKDDYVVSVPRFNIDRPTLRAVCEYDFSPYSFLDAQKRPGGHDVELLYRIGEILGVNVEISLLPWQDAQEAFAAGRYEVMASVSDIPERRKQMDFSEPVAYDAYAAFGKKVNAFERDDWGRRRLATVAGSSVNTGFIAAHGLEGQTRQYNNYLECLHAVAEGQRDLALMPLSSGVRLAHEHGFTDIRTDRWPLMKTEYCLAVKKGKQALLEKINNALYELQKSGEKDRIYRRWLVNYSAGKTPLMLLLENNELLLIKVASAAFCLFVIFFGGLCFYHQRRHNLVLEESNNALLTAQKVLHERMAVVEAVSGLYTGVYFISLADFKFKLFSRSDSINLGLLRTNDMRDVFDFNLNNLVEPEFRDNMADFTNLRTLGLRMRDTDSLSAEYRRKEFGWCRGNFLTVERDPSGKVLSVLYLHQIIDKLKQKELDEQKALHERMQLINSFGSAYFYASHINIPMRRFQEICGAEYVTRLVGRKGNAAAALTTFVSAFSRSDFHDSLHAFFNLDTLSARLDSVNMLSQEYFSLKAGWVRAYFIAAERDNDRRAVGAIFAVQAIDESKRKELETQAALRLAIDNANRANNAKTDFLSRISHDIRTPMNGIIGMTNIAKTHINDPERVADCLNKISGASAHLLALLNEVIDVSQIESGKISFSEDNLLLTEYFNGVVESIRPWTEAKKQTVVCSFCDIKHNSVVSDKAKLGEVLTNLLSNASKFTPDGGKIEVSLQEKPYSTPDVGTYELTVADSGIGISPEFEEHVFDAFSRDDESRIGNVPGNGLGLAVVKNIVEAMGCTISVASTPGKGTVFTLTLYFKLQAGAVAAGKTLAGDDRLEFADYSGKRVLLVEDNDLNAEIAEDVLRGFGLDVVRVADGRQAVDDFSGRDFGYYDLVFMDVQMPVMDGYSATRAIRMLNRPDAGQIPIVAMTANAFASDVLAARDAGMNDHVAKPIGLTQLKTVLRQWLARTIN